MFWLRFLISPLTVDGSYKSFALSLAHVRLNLISLRLIPLCSWSLSNPHSAVIIILWTGFKQLCSRCPWVSPHQVDTSRGFVLLWSTKTFLNNYQWLPLWIQWNAMRISTHSTPVIHRSHFLQPTWWNTLRWVTSCITVTHRDWILIERTQDYKHECTHNLKVYIV